MNNDKLESFVGTLSLDESVRLFNVLLNVIPQDDVMEELHNWADENGLSGEEL